MHFDISIQEGIITIDCKVETYGRQEHFSDIYHRALEISWASVNLVAFSMGIAALPILDTFTDPDGNTTALVNRDRPLEALCTAFSPASPDFHDFLTTVLLELPLHNALRDLIWAISTPNEIPPSCARAVETLRTLMTPAGSDRKLGWSLMRENLRLTEEYLKLITEHAKGPRHGDHRFVPGTMTREIATRAWTVMNRFLEYRKRGSQPLPEQEFPLLCG
jgi:hypothetical protein